MRTRKYMRMRKTRRRRRKCSELKKPANQDHLKQLDSAAEQKELLNSLKRKEDQLKVQLEPALEEKQLEEPLEPALQED